MGNSRNSSAVTTATAPPPPLSAQKRPVWVLASTRSSSPSAVTTSAATRCRQARPYLRPSPDIPPPTLSPGPPTRGRGAAGRRGPVLGGRGGHGLPLGTGLDARGGAHRVDLDA